MNASSRNVADIVGRVFISVMFLMAGIGKLGASYAGTQGYMESHGVPGMLLPLVIALEIGGAALIIAGWWTRTSALVLAAFTVLAAMLFHAEFADRMQQIMFMKNIAIAGGSLFLVANGAGAWSVDARRAKT